MGIDANTPLGKAIARTRQVFNNESFDGHTRRKADGETRSGPAAEIGLIQQAGEIKGAELVLRRIAGSVSIGALLDCTTEIRYALVFEGLRFAVEFVRPGPRETPDILVSRDDQSAYVEVTRIRPTGSQSFHATLDPDTGDEISSIELEEYGGDEDVRKIEQGLRAKFRQVKAVAGSNTIIATWSDRDSVEEIDFGQAIRNIRLSPTDPEDGRRIPDGLLFCIFGWFWVPCRTGQQLYCAPLRELAEPFLTWSKELERTRRFGY